MLGLVGIVVGTRDVGADGFGPAMLDLGVHPIAIGADGKVSTTVTTKPPVPDALVKNGEPGDQKMVAALSRIVVTGSFSHTGDSRWGRIQIEIEGHSSHNCGNELRSKTYSGGAPIPNAVPSSSSSSSRSSAKPTCKAGGSCYFGRAQSGCLSPAKCKGTPGVQRGVCVCP